MPRFKAPYSSATLALTAALMLLAAPAQAKGSKADTLVPDGPPVDCLRLHQIRDTQIRDDQTIDFEVGMHKIYRNTLPHSCPGLAAAGKYLHETSTGDICSVDMIKILYSYGLGLSQGPSCGLGKFQPMKPADK